VARLTVRVSPDGADATVVVGGRTVPPAGWEVPIAVDPGDVVVRATAPDGRRFEQTLHLDRGSNTEVVVALEVPLSPAVEAALLVRAVRREAPAPALRSTAPRNVGAGPWVVAGGGVAALVIAGVLWSMHDAAVSERDGLCPPSGCDPAALNANARAQDMTLGTNVAIGLGSAAVVGGLTWFLVAWGGRAEAPAVRPSAWLHPGSAGLTLAGTF
jgi:hypothetical protein